ncbi:MAG: hypothetical protein KAJ63_02615 [Methyloprofundus sp.]|nr:hypothetical protein [Methyloprofundus sp.]
MLLIGLLRQFGESISQFTLERLMAYMESMERDAEKYDVPSSFITKKQPDELQYRFQ